MPPLCPPAPVVSDAAADVDFQRSYHLSKLAFAARPLAVTNRGSADL
jgi:hypothetical protein